MFHASPVLMFTPLPSLGFAVLLLAASPAAAQESAILSLKDTLRTEVQARAFTLPRPMRVHVYAKGGGEGEQPLHAYGWILDAATREVVWQMDGRNAKVEGAFRVADQYLDLKAGSYEAYYSNHGFSWAAPFGHGIREIDRRRLVGGAPAGERDRFGFRAIFESLRPGRLHEWKAQVGHYGMEVYAAAAEAAEVKTAPAPLAWRGEVLALGADRDDGTWSAAFKVSRPVTLHVYAQGERVSHDGSVDTGWILDAQTRKPVWELHTAKGDYAGGASKNIRKVETLALPAGEYVVGYRTDDSHSPAHWNAPPPCDPLRYGLVLSLPKEADAAAFAKVPVREPGRVLAALVGVGDHQHRQTNFALAKAARVRIYALGEADDGRMEDRAWITDAGGVKVWTMASAETEHAGGAAKNRVQDKILSLPPGTYTLHYRTDGSHAYGRWNDTPPRDTEHYGATVYAVE
jgi:hypothetical protein